VDIIFVSLLGLNGEFYRKARRRARRYGYGFPEVTLIALAFGKLGGVCSIDEFSHGILVSICIDFESTLDVLQFNV